MARTSDQPNQPPRTARPRRARRSDLSRRVVEYVLRANSRLDGPQEARQIADALGVPYSTVTAALRRLVGSGRLVPRFIVNGFRTRYCHEYRVALAIDGRAIASSHKKRRERLSRSPLAAGLRDGGPDELFIEELIDSLANNRAFRDHLIVQDAILLHGAQDRDVELCMLTDDGSFSLGCWIRNELSENPCIRGIHTVTVGYRYNYNGYSGQNVNHDRSPADTVVGGAMF